MEGDAIHSHIGPRGKGDKLCIGVTVMAPGVDTSMTREVLAPAVFGREHGVGIGPEGYEPPEVFLTCKAGDIHHPAHLLTPTYEPRHVISKNFIKDPAHGGATASNRDSYTDIHKLVDTLIVHGVNNYGSTA